MKLRLIMTVAMALVTVLVLFFAARSGELAIAAPETAPEAASGPSQEVIVEEVSLTEEIEKEEEEPEPVARAVIDDSYKLTTRSVVHTGSITNSLTGDPIPGELKEMCNGKEENSFETDGEFKIEYACNPGLTAWLEFDFDGKTYHTNHVVMPYPARARSSGSSAAPIETVQAPEFSTATLAIVIIGGCFGLVLLRKQ